MSILKAYTAISELEAVNLMLSTLGSSPVSSLTSGNDLHVSMAQQFLHNASREVQSTGYYFNYETEYPLARNIANEIPVPSNALKLEISDTFYDDDVVMRGTRLYDLKGHTYTFTKNLTADITLFLPWEDTPQPFRQYITILAARRFQRRVQGDEIVEKFTAVEESMAKTNLEDYEADASDYNLKDSDEVLRILER